MANKEMIHGARIAANSRSVYKAPDVGEVVRSAGSTVEAFKGFKEREKQLAFRKLDIEANGLQMEEMEQIRVAQSVDEIPEISKSFNDSLKAFMGDQKYGKEWLIERGEIYSELNNNDVFKATKAKEKELNSINLNETLKTAADDIVKSSPEKASFMFGQVDKDIDSDPYLTPLEKQNTKDNFRKRAVSGMVISNPRSAAAFLSSQKEIPGLSDIEKNEYLKKAQDIIHAEEARAMAMASFAEKRRVFETEQKLSAELDDLPFSDALKTLQENEGVVSSKYFKAKQKALLSSKGITAETRAETALEVMMDIASLDKNKTVSYLQGADDVLAKIEDKYAEGELSLSDKRGLIRQIQSEQGKQVDDLKYDDSGSFLFWGYSFKDANNYAEKNLSKPSQAPKAMLEYFRATQEQELSADEKKKVMNGIVNKYNMGVLSRPRFSSENEAMVAFNSGNIKIGDIIYINGQEVEVGK